jgi:hypothetical protein
MTGRLADLRARQVRIEAEIAAIEDRRDAGVPRGRGQRALDELVAELDQVKHAIAMEAV